MGENLLLPTTRLMTINTLRSSDMIPEQDVTYSDLAQIHRNLLFPPIPTCSVDLGASDVRLVPPCPTVRSTPSQTAVTATTSTRHEPTLVQTDVAHTDKNSENNNNNNNNNNTFATPPRGERLRNPTDKLSSPVSPRQTQKKV